MTDTPTPLHEDRFTVEISHRPIDGPEISKHDVARWIEDGYTADRRSAQEERKAAEAGEEVVVRTVPEIESFDVKPG